MNNAINGIQVALGTRLRITAVVLLSVFFYGAIVTFQNYSYLHELVYFSLSVFEKIGLFFTFIFSPFSIFSPTSFIFTMLAIILFSIQLVMLWYWVQVRRSAFEGNSAAVSFGGGLAAVLGIGCASCGSVFVTSVAASTGIAINSFLPFGGAELPVISCVLLVMAVYQLGKKINTPFVC